MDTLVALQMASMDMAEAALRLTAAVVLAGAVGLEREVAGKPLGLRTLMLVALASALLTVVAMELYAGSPAGERIDPGRILQGIISGLGLLGAGVILHREATVRWATTGAAVWLTGALGIACGLGYYAPAAMATALGLIVLIVLGWVEAALKR